ncbi:protein ALP1-like [Acyrthosiphon pisum]|uniref:DDE Tnp4 domain-containing protein n=1 Tax=Acyrthosiphon pisum TaxID=7029 RepID=A0A8R2NM91_ACYPI|nr:protein ALP1-like [Acyrthosiphon pisum]
MTQDNIFLTDPDDNKPSNCEIGITSFAKQIVIETCRAIVHRLMPEAMPTPTEDRWEQIAQDFWMLLNFSNCLGAIDGKHVTIQAPPNSGSNYFNYKKTFSIVLFALVDAHNNFIAVDVGSYGKNSDGGILSHSNLGKALENNLLNIPESKTLPGTNTKAPFVIVGDEAFPLNTYLLIPYPGKQLDDFDKKIYGYRL